LKTPRLVRFLKLIVSDTFYSGSSNSSSGIGSSSSSSSSNNNNSSSKYKYHYTHTHTLTWLAVVACIVVKLADSISLFSNKHFNTGVIQLVVHEALLITFSPL